MDRDLSLDTTADGWFPDGIEILPRPPFIAIAAVLAAFAAIAAVLAAFAAIATVVRLLRVH